MLRRAFNFTWRWLAPAVLVVSLLLLVLMLAVRLGVLRSWYSWGKQWGKPYADAEYEISCDSDEIHFWHNDVVDSLIGPATVKINADLKPLALHDPQFPFTADYFQIGFDNTKTVRSEFGGFRRGDLRFSWDHTDPINFLGPPIGTYLIVDVPWGVLTDTFAVAAVCSGLVLLNRLSNRLRFRPGFCRNCSYDLTGNTSGVCPECGSSIVEKNGIT